jgi:hypothetical protein
MKLSISFIAITSCLCSAYLSFSAISSPSSQSALVVSTTSGTFRGVSSNPPNNTEKWLGVPFAQPPLGGLRFKAPVPLVVPFPHEVVQDASQFGAACPQEPSATLGAAMSEDCLKLNVSGACRDICILPDSISVDLEADSYNRHR